MTPTTTPIEKADDRLRKAIDAAGADANLVVLLVLNDAAPVGPPDAIEPSPADFPNRATFRQALIERKMRRQQARFGHVLDPLRMLKLNPRGAVLGRVVVIEGTSQQVLEALKLEAVEAAKLDQPLELIKPRRPANRRIATEETF